MSAITSHVLDTALGRPAAGMLVLLEFSAGADQWVKIGHGTTDSDGRVRTLMPESAPLNPGFYRLTFNTRMYFERQAVRAFFPQVSIVFEATAGETHYHVPLLLSPFGYATYRGS